MKPSVVFVKVILFTFPPTKSLKHAENPLEWGLFYVI